MKNLYIIGNGFDCHHGINSSYSAYRQWLEENEPELYERLREFYYVDDDEWWWQFEVNLGENRTCNLHTVYCFGKSAGFCQ